MQTFYSKVDWWFYVALLSIPVAVVLPVLLAPTSEGAFQVLGFTLLAMALPLWLLGSTRYDVTEHQLLIRSGPFRWQIAIDEIRDIQPSRSLLSSPALSLDRLKIDYGSNKSVLVSPKDKAGFLEMIKNHSRWQDG